jgi:hypothetical protein
MTDNTDCLNLPAVASDLEAEFVDTRSRSEKIGEIPRRTKRGKTLSVKLETMLTAPAPLNTAERDIRLRARRMALDYCEQMIINLYDIAMNSPSVSVRVEASKQICHIALGKPGNMPMADFGGSGVPNLTIVFGNQEPVTFDGTAYMTDED